MSFANGLLLSALLLGVAAQPGIVQAEGQAEVQARIFAPSRVVNSIDDSQRVALRGNRHPMAKPEFDRGLADAARPLERMLLVLKRSPEQEKALADFNERQYDPESPDFHHWIHAEEFGRIYGPSDSDIAAVTGWLENHGFQVTEVSKGRVTIEFSGTAAQVQEAFRVEMHRYLVNGVEHIANDRDPQIPEALLPVVTGIASLHDFFSKPQSVMGKYVKRDRKTGKIMDLESVGDQIDMFRAAQTAKDAKLLGGDRETRPMLTYVDTAGLTREAVTPYDLATIYNILPLWNASTPIIGKSVNIAIAGRSDVVLSDITAFRKSFGLPVLTLTTIHNGSDPGDVSGDQSENTLDVEMAGATAPGATLSLVVSASTATSDGAQLSDSYIIDNEVAPVMSSSYGQCELFLGTAGNAAINNIWQQGATEGISIFASAGDQGSAGCANSDASAPYADSYGLQVNGIASSPYVTAVGGTDFTWSFINEPITTYWNTANSSNLATAKGYLPEVPWNSTCSNPLLLNLFTSETSVEQLCNDAANSSNFQSLVRVGAGSGGASSCTTPSGNTSASCSGEYAKPSWQTGPGVPKDGKRDLPDVSLFASGGFPGGINGSALLFCQASGSPEGTCDYTNPNYIIYQEVGGTSASSPLMAGVMALIVQKTGTSQGLANPILYKLAQAQATAGTACDSSTVTNGNKCVFYDISQGTNSQVCFTGGPNCVTNSSTDQAGLLSGYAATAGYDQAVGLGSMNVANLVNSWPLTAQTASVTPTTLSFPATTVGVTSTTKGTVTVKNTGTTPLTFSSIKFTGTNPTSFAAITTCPLGSTLASGATCTITVSFDPAATGALSSSLNIVDGAGTQTVAVSGTGTAATLTVSLAPTSLTFASTVVGATSTAQVVTVTNTGNSAVSLGSTSFTGTNAASFLKSATTCTTSLPVSASCTISVEFKPTAAGSLTAALSIVDNATGSPQTVTLNGIATASAATGLQFIAVTPCRVADTRNATGAFGGPELAAKATREFDIPKSNCGIPTTAVAYSLNVTVVPGSSLNYLTLWPSGQPQPNVSTLNSDGRIKANAAITPAGTNGGVNVYVSDATHVILDIDGYFVPAGTASALAFYPLAPCRVADTRNAAGTLGGPYIPGNSSRAFPVQSSNCKIPSTAKAYSLNVTALPHSTLNYLTTWPTGQAQPNVSTLNSSTGVVTANAAIVPVGTGGDISIFVSDSADVILDVNGYFAAPASGGLSLYTVTPCRVLDTRSSTGAFNGVLAVAVHSSTCAPPSTAQAYVLNATVVPPVPLNYLTLWPAGSAQPNVSTLNANDGAITSNMAIVPTTNGSIDAFSSNQTQLILDIASYFAP